MKKHICHISTAHNRDDVRIFYKECSTLFSNGYSISLIISDCQGSDNNAGISIIDIGVNTARRFLRMTKGVFFAYCKAIKLNADLYHFHDSELIPVGLLLKLKGKKVIYDVHEDTPKQILSKNWIPKYARNIISYVFNKLEKNISRFFDAIITATPSIKGEFISFNKKCVDVNNYPLIEEINTDFSWSGKKKAVCYIGGISEIRGIEALVNSLELTDCFLILAGEFLDSSFEKHIRSLQGWSKVDYRGVVNRDQVYDIFKQSMAGLVTFFPVPNHTEAQPNKMFEYMSAGLPVICSNFQLWEKIVVGNNCGLCVDPMSINEIAKAINSMINNVSEAQRMGTNGRKAVLEKYNWGFEEKKLLELYGGLL